MRRMSAAANVPPGLQLDAARLARQNAAPFVVKQTGGRSSAGRLRRNRLEAEALERGNSACSLVVVKASYWTRGNLITPLSVISNPKLPQYTQLPTTAIYCRRCG